MTNGRFLRILLAALAACGGCTDTISGQGGSMKPPPIAPTNLAGAVQANGKNVDLTWVDGSGNESGFRVEVNTSPFGAPPYVGVFFVGANNPNYTYSAPLPNTTYYFRVYAITGSTQSDPSNVISLAAGTFPLEPSYFSALAVSSNTVNLTWLNGSGDNGNIIERSTDLMTWTPIFNGPTGPNLQSFADFPLSSDTVYYYRAYAKINSVVSDVSNVTSTRTQGFVQSMVANGSGGLHSSIAFDDFDVQRIVSYDVWSLGLVLTTGNWPPSTYSSTSIGSGFGNGYHGCSVATNNIGRVFVAAHEYGSDQLKFISNEVNISVFATTVVDSDVMFVYDIFGKKPVIRISPADQSVHIVYKVETTTAMNNGDLRHAWRGPASTDPWFIETVAPFEAVMKHHSFVIDGAGVLHVVYSSQPGGGVQPTLLRHARKSTGPGATWNHELITDQGRADMSSVTVGPSNSLHVAYNDDSTGGLWYATDRTGPWTTEEVHTHTGDNIGINNSIVYFSTTPADVHISYYELNYGNLWYAGKKGANGTWNRKLLDSTNDVGRYSTINHGFFDVYVTYYDLTNSWLKIVKNPQN